MLLFLATQSCSCCFCSGFWVRLLVSLLLLVRVLQGRVGVRVLPVDDILTKASGCVDDTYVS